MTFIECKGDTSAFSIPHFSYYLQNQNLLVPSVFTFSGLKRHDTPGYKHKRILYLIVSENGPNLCSKITIRYSNPFSDLSN